MKNKFAVEYSLKQQVFHIHTISEMLEKNISKTLRNVKIDFLPIGIFDTCEQANDFAEIFQASIEKKLK